MVKEEVEKMICKKACKACHVGHQQAGLPEGEKGMRLVEEAIRRRLCKIGISCLVNSLPWQYEATAISFGNAILYLGPLAWF